jgi:hypothetical protein
MDAQSVLNVDAPQQFGFHLPAANRSGTLHAKDQDDLVECLERIYGDVTGMRVWRLDRDE